jgi:hypothetical protein
MAVVACVKKLDDRRTCIMLLDFVAGTVAVK